MTLGFKSLWIRLKAVISHELHANMSPTGAAFSLALGILVGFSPFYGLHTPIVIGLAFLFRLNRPLALAAASSTILPFVPIWVAGGVFMGRIIVSLDTSAQLVASLRARLPGHAFDAFAAKMLVLAKHLPLLNKASKGGEDYLLSVFMQWFIGCCVLAVVSAIATFFISYFIIIQVKKRRQKRAAAKHAHHDGP